MILEVDEVGYADAAAAFRSGNRAAADVLAGLTAGLAGTGRMAGDDAGGGEFAAAYDGAAGEAVAGLADVAAAFATLGRLTELSDAEHRRSEARAIIPGAVVDPGCVAPPAAAYLRPQQVRPPSSLGGDPPALTPEEDWVLDHLEGFVWPGADVDRLRSAARQWRATVAALDGLSDCCGVAADALLTQRSPEVPLAVAAADDLRALVRGLAGDCADLAQHCDSYADAVEARHAQLRALLREVLALVVEGVVIAVALSAVTAGVAAAGGTAAIALRVAATAPRFHALLLALRATTSALTASLRSAHAALVARRARLDRFLRLPPRTERGAIGPLLRPRRGPGWLAAHERSGGHTLKNHVAKSADELRDRVAAGRVGRASTFRNEASAERLIDETLSRNRQTVEDWLASGLHKREFDARFLGTTGTSIRRGGEIEDVQGVRVVLFRDPDMPDGYRVHTAFPTP